jgi:hypothetical protein
VRRWVIFETIETSEAAYLYAVKQTVIGDLLSMIRFLKAGKL